MKKMLLLMGLAALCCLSVALTLNVNVAANGWQNSNRGTNTAPLLTPGVPQMNYLPVRVLLPFGEKVQNVRVFLRGEATLQGNVELDYVRAQQPTSSSLPDNTQPDPSIWQKNALYPGKDFDFLGTQSMRGYVFAVLNVYPWKYNPVQKVMQTFPDLRIEIDTAWDADVARNSANFYAPALDNTDIRAFVLNPESINSYSAAPQYRDHTPQGRLIDLGTPKKMIIITNGNSQAYFQNYVQWRSAQNVSTAIYLTSDIYAEYDGQDNAQKVRNFIIDAYQTWAGTATPLEYVILGGDDEIVPQRGCYGQVGDTTDDRMPTDIYFSNLDGNWNNDGDNLWGEVLDQTDLLPEVAIGRFPAETSGEFANIIRKTQYYVNNSTFSNNICVLFGELLNNNPWTWGDDYKDSVAEHIPESYAYTRIYEGDGNYNAANVWNAINNGAHVMNHMGHANQTFLLGQGNGTVEQLQNTEYGFLYSQGCYPAAFDQLTSGDGECIAEHFVTTEGGLFTFIGNTRYGWYAPGSIDGASEFFDREYFAGLYETLNTQFGKALNYSKLQNLNAAMSNDVMRWCYYEVVLFGDPSIEVKYPDPSLPLLSLQDYTISDVEGDGDGSYNPGEILRIYPVIHNDADWAPAYDVSVQLENLPEGVTMLGGPLVIPVIQPGANSDPSLYFRIQLPQSGGYGSYSLKMTVDSIHPVTNQSTGIRRFPVSYAITMIDNRFPWDYPVQTKSAPVVYDFDNDGDLEISYLDVHGDTHFINTSGDEYSSFDAPQQLEIIRSSAFGDITGDGVPELVSASRTGRVYAATPEGQTVFNHAYDSPFLFTPVIARIDNSGTDKVIASSLDGYLHAFNNNGTYLCGFPQDVGSPVYTEMAAADINADGLMEIICGTQSGMLHVVTGAGAEVSGYPEQFEGAITGAPVVTGNNNVVFGTNTHVIMLSPQGYIVFNEPISASMAGGPVIADLDGDGYQEIIFVTLSGMLYVMYDNGDVAPGFPISIGANFNTPPLIANLDDDYYPEILLSSYINSVYAFNQDGSPVAGFPFVTSFNGCTPGTLCDLDNNGMLKLVSGYSTGVVVMNLRKPATNITPWITYRGSLKRQGSFASTGYVANDDPTVPVFTDQLAQNYPNPFNPQTTISFETAKAANASLCIYNLRGQLIRTLQGGKLDAGKHSVIWDGKDNTGSSVSSGIYLYRLSTGEKTLTRRMLLVK
jgi:hypothetical protein